MNILVTGGAGFIGSHIADACIGAGHTVSIIDNLSMGKKENINPKATFHQCDIRDEKIRSIFEQGRFEVVFHLAAQMDVRKSVEDPIFDASVNILGTLNLLEQCRRSGVKKFIFASTGGAIYGEQDYFPADEAHPLRPLSPYGITKLAVEKYLFYYKEVFGLQFIALRFANINADEGSGLGLPIVKGLIELHGGQFLLKSKVREGTDAIVALPPQRVMNALPKMETHAGAKAAQRFASA